MNRYRANHTKRFRNRVSDVFDFGSRIQIKSCVEKMQKNAAIPPIAKLDISGGIHSLSRRVCIPSTTEL